MEEGVGGIGVDVAIVPDTSEDADVDAMAEATEGEEDGWSKRDPPVPSSASAPQAASNMDTTGP